jgi:hypothetical protein
MNNCGAQTRHSRPHRTGRAESPVVVYNNRDLCLIGVCKAAATLPHEMPWLRTSYSETIISSIALCFQWKSGDSRAANRDMSLAVSLPDLLQIFGGMPVKLSYLFCARN